MSLDGYVEGETTIEDQLGVGGEDMHEWGVATASWREAHGARAASERRRGSVAE